MFDRCLRIARSCLLAGIVAALGGCAPSDRGNVPTGYSRSYADTITRALDGRSLTIWSAVDEDRATRLLAAFRRRYPGLTVRYVEMPTNDLYQHVRDEADHHRPVADIVWSSAMDLQIKLVNDDYTQAYVSPERANIPDWANWKNHAWGTTAEPITFVYNRHLISDALVPRSHIALTRLLEANPPAFDQMIATYDPNRSAVGYLFLSQDEQATHDVWRLVHAMGQRRARLFITSEAMLDDIAAGRQAIGYNIIGSYAVEALARHPDLAMILPTDYTLLMSRIAVIPARAAHPDAAKLFLDFLLSRAGQQLLAQEDMPSVRSDVAPPPALRGTGVPLRAIRVGPALLVDQDQLTRRYFLRRWNEAMGDAPVERNDQLPRD